MSRKANHEKELLDESPCRKRDLRKFAADSNFKGFFEAHKPLYQIAVARCEALVNDAGIQSWAGKFFGGQSSSRYIIALSMVDGGRNYGTAAKLKDGKIELYSILGVWRKDGKGDPAFDKDAIEIIVHEFCHSYVNPAVDRHLEQLKAAGERIFPYVSEKMSAQAYSGWETMFYESYVRSCVVRYMLAAQGQAAAQKNVDWNNKRGFIWWKFTGISAREKSSLPPIIS